MPRNDDPQAIMDRRTFLSETARHGTALAGLALAPRLVAAETPTGQSISEVPEAIASPPEISVVSGPSAYQSTLRAIEEIGGIQQFVSPGDRVGLLMNTWADKPGTYTHHEVVLAVAQLCYWAGATKVVCLKDEDEDYWELYPDRNEYAKLIAALPPAESSHRDVSVRGRALETAEVLEIALDFERLINLPIAKNHSGCKMTGCLKNMMGLTSFSTNKGFHWGDSPITTAISNIGNSFPMPEHFGQCVADLYEVRRPDLCVLDATEMVTTNGPSGPGKLVRPREVIAGTDPVAMDALACGHLGLKPEEVFILKQAHASGVGTFDLGQRRIRRVDLG